MNTLLRILNTLLFAGILGMLILIFQHMPREPIAIVTPVPIVSGDPFGAPGAPIRVEIDNTPLEVELSR
jgi:hypothetical protein